MITIMITKDYDYNYNYIYIFHSIISIAVIVMTKLMFQFYGELKKKPLVSKHYSSYYNYLEEFVT